MTLGAIEQRHKLKLQDESKREVMKRALPAWLKKIGEDDEQEPPSKMQVLAGRQDEASDSAATKADEEEEDYLNMTFAAPDETASASSLLSKQDRARVKRADAGRQPPPTQAQAAETARNAGLAKPVAGLDPASSKAFKMMQRMGYSQGDTLGVQETFAKDALKEPLAPSVLLGRGGLGLAAEQKRAFLAAAEQKVAIEEAETSDFRAAVRTDKETRRIEGQCHAAQAVLERLEVDALGEDIVAAQKRVNVLWRSRRRYREEKERERTMRQQMLDHAMTFSHRQFNEDDAALPPPSTALRLSTHEEDETKDAAEAMERRRRLRAQVVETDEEEEEADLELEAFLALDVADQLEQILEHLRERYSYCFWCGHRYKDGDELGELCPGLAEVDH